MEQERVAREQEEKERVERMKKIKDQFADPNSQWEKDKTDIQNEAMKEKKEKEKAEATAEETKPVAAESLTDVKSDIKGGVKPVAKVEEIAPAKEKVIAWVRKHSENALLFY